MCHISQGSVAACLRCGGFLMVIEVWTLVSIVTGNMVVALALKHRCCIPATL